MNGLTLMYTPHENPQYCPFKECSVEEERTIIHSAMNKLSKRELEVVLESFGFNGLPQGSLPNLFDVGRFLDLSNRTVSQYKKNAIRKLRAELKPYFIETQYDFHQ